MQELSSPQTANILVVDDAYENLCLIQAILESADYAVIPAESGEEALAAIAQSPPDLILSDVMMPGMSGTELTQNVRQQEQLPYIPILLITAQERSDVVEGLDAGADDFIRKPVEVDELLARVRSMLRLKQSIDEREQIIGMREEFVYRLTHDMRTPLVAADRMFTLLQRGKYGDIDPAAQMVLSSIQVSNADLLTMINNLLAIYRYEAGHKALSFTQFDLKVLVEGALDELQPLAEEKDIVLHLQATSTEPDADKQYHIYAARLELKRMITNLVGNAIKYTETGSVTIQLHQTDQYTELQVIDTGCGIAQQDLPIVFERAFQGSHKFSGSGLGLNLVRQIAEAHGGTVTVQSHLNIGSTFTVKLPMLD